MLFSDPIPTPAARCGRAAVVAGLVGWCCLTLAGALYAASLAVVDDDMLGTSLRVAGGWIVAPAAVAYLAGTLWAAAGVTRQMHAVPDPGRKLVIAGFLLNGLPMLLVAAAGAYDKVGRKLIEG